MYLGSNVFFYTKYIEIQEDKKKIMKVNHQLLTD